MYRNASFKTYSGIERSNMVASFCRIAFLGEKCGKQDQLQCEDILIGNRQPNLEEEFSSFVDGSRMDTCDRFHKIFKPKDQLTAVHCERLTCLIFEVCSNSCLYIGLSNLYIYIYIYILKTMKNESLLCFCATRFTAVAALQA